MAATWAAGGLKAVPVDTLNLPNRKGPIKALVLYAHESCAYKTKALTGTTGTGTAGGTMDGRRPSFATISLRLLLQILRSRAGMGAGRPAPRSTNAAEQETQRPALQLE